MKNGELPEELKREFREIAGEIVHPNLMEDEIREIAKRWAENTVKIMATYGISYDEESLKIMEEENIEKIKSLRKRLGLE